MKNLLVRLFGWRAAVIHGDPCVADRWRWLTHHLPRGPWRTLDAGCGSGAFTFYAASLGHDALGFSFDTRNTRVAIERARLSRLPTARFLEGDLRHLERLAPTLGTFDYILCLETLEHLQEDRRVLGDLAALLKPGGRIVITTPYKPYRHLLGDRLSVTEDGGHVRWGYTHEELRALCAACGVEVIHASFVSGVVSQQLTNLMRLLSQVEPHLAWALTLPLRPLQWLDAPLTRWLRYPYLCIGVVGQKRVQ